MAKRFKNFKTALKLLVPLNGGEAQDLPDTSPLGYYQAVVSGKKKVEYGNRAASSQPGSLIIYALMPFAEPDADAATAKVTLSKRSEGATGTTGISMSVLNIVKTATEMNDAVEIYGFVPAKATITIKTPGDGTPTTSKQTGRSYKDDSNASYTYPFGMNKSALTQGYKALKNAIINAIKADNRSVSFTPEIYR
ncbi:hypothetical protein [Cylindrospermum sp. FACHB-282]|uniref:hypothetical protein n=1 Tax=Cylindrospermum sp. FACHB-282 TaxID=2692794 RepID=UPI0016897AF6|nr:hypothetical protein [Cylindrospermum sp. FACHB-282]MBD2388444.1 hypothetical protein [Cylindrospermum sp. FACHB-282]